MTDDNRARWQNVAQAAQWLAEGREVEEKVRNSEADWIRSDDLLGIGFEYRLKPEPPKPREWTLHLGNHNSCVASGPLSQPGIIERVRVREILE